MQRAKEAAADVAASARSGMEKTKATVEGTAEKLTTRDPLRKEMAEEKRGARVQEAEFEKQRAYDQNAAARSAPGDYAYTARAPRSTAGGPVVGAEHPAGVIARGAVGSQYPAGVTTTGTGRTDVLDADLDRDSPEGGVQEPRIPGGARTACGSF